MDLCDYQQVLKFQIIIYQMISDIPTVFSGFVPIPSIPNTVGVQVLGKLDQTIRESGDYESITDLVLDEIQFHSFSPEIHQMLSRCKSLTYLSMEFCELNSLENISIFPNLEILELGYNKLKGKDLVELSSIPTLRSIVLTKNNFTSIDLPNLFKLTLLQNPVANLPDYRQKMFQILPKLEVLDGRDRDNQSVESEREDADQQGDSYDSEEDEDDDGEDEEYGKQSNFNNGDEPPMRKIKRLEE